MKESVLSIRFTSFKRTERQDQGEREAGVMCAAEEIGARNTRTV